MSDQYGNYVATLQPVWSPPTGIIITGSVGRGHGPPNAGTPNWLLLYIDADSQLVYQNTNDTLGGWVLASGGSISGVTGVYWGHGFPASITPPGAAIYYDLDDMSQYQWNGVNWL